MKTQKHLLLILSLFLAIPAVAADYRQWATADQWQIYGELVTVAEYEGEPWVVLRRPNGETVYYRYHTLSERSRKMAVQIMQYRQKAERQKADYDLNVEIHALEMEIHMLEEEARALGSEEDYAAAKNKTNLASLKRQQLKRLYDQRAAVYKARQK